MPLDIGDQGATRGLARAIYEPLDALLRPRVPTENLADAQRGWKELAFAIATGVVGHLLANLEVKVAGVSATGAVSLPVSAGNASGNVTLSQGAAVTAQVR